MPNRMRRQAIPVEHKSYRGLDREHETVTHSDGEYVRDEVHTNSIESFWSMLKRAQMGTYHKISPKHLNRYVRAFAGRHNLRKKNTLDQMAHVVAGLVGKRLMYSDLIAPHPDGLSSGARGDVNPRVAA